METVSVGNIVFIPFPFSDLSGSKLRPAILLARASKEDWILCQITSQSYLDSQSLRIDDRNFISGSLQRESYVRVGKLFTAKSILFRKNIGSLKTETMQVILQKVIDVFEQSRKEL